tara:strand:+ start:247 stop:510 length:264 start_codon:yes stop_codon:yes gene_type:complete
MGARLKKRLRRDARRRAEEARRLGRLVPLEDATPVTGCPIGGQHPVRLQSPPGRSYAILLLHYPLRALAAAGYLNNEEAARRVHGLP